MTKSSARWRHAILAGTMLAVAGCARDVVLKPAVIGFNTDAHRAIDASARQYDDAIKRLNLQTADFLAANPECGLATEIVPRRANRTAPQAGGYCLSQAERDAFSGRQVTEKLPIATRETFAPQFAALDLLVDYIGFLAAHADDPRLTTRADIAATAAALTSLGGGISALSGSVGGPAFNEFAPGGAVEKFGGAVGALAEQIEMIAKQANDVKALETRIKASAPAIEAALDELAVSADAWNCAAIERRLAEGPAYASEWNPRLAGLTLAARREVTQRFVALSVLKLPAWCPGAEKPGPGHGEVAAMLIGVQAAHRELIDIANHDYTPAQRKAIIEATLGRLGTLLSRIAAVVPLLP
jgi:hypothetical protein